MAETVALDQECVFAFFISLDDSTAGTSVARYGQVGEGAFDILDANEDFLFFNLGGFSLAAFVDGIDIDADVGSPASDVERR